MKIHSLLRIDGNNLRLYTSHWAPERWQEYEPLLNYCRDNGVKLVACGTPLEVIHMLHCPQIVHVINSVVLP
jgi:uncharacterized iron-regulated protein